MSNEILVQDVVQSGGMLKGKVTLSYEVDVVVGYSGKGNKETLDMILKAQALEQIRENLIQEDNTI